MGFHYSFELDDDVWQDRVQISYSEDINILTSYMSPLSFFEQNIFLGTYAPLGAPGDYFWANAFPPAQPPSSFPFPTSFGASLDASALIGVNGFVINGIGGFSGQSVSDAGDVNGDGFDDILIGAFGANSLRGQSYLVFGSGSGFAASLDASSLNGTNGFILNGIDMFDTSGFSVSGAGDINNDGFDDILIGALGGDPNGSASGESYVVFGSGSGFSASLDLSSLNGTNGFVLNGIDADDQSGYIVSGAGDINGDGFDDILIGAPYADPNSSASGESYVVFGSGSGFGASFELSSLNGANGFAIYGIDVNDNSGFAVSGAGDINGDGFDDIIVGAPDADPNGGHSGESYVVFGSNAGFPANLNLSALNGANGFVINGIDGDDKSGLSVSGAGDINGDGYGDLIIGATGGDPNGANSGESYIVFGNGSGFGASLDLSGLNGTNGFVINGIDAGDISGFSVSGAGDFNGDGFDDILIGASNADTGGASYLLFGRESGFGASFELSTITGIDGFVINGIDAGDGTGRSVSRAGDLNGDGFDDIIVGAPYADPNGSSSGESYVMFGRMEFELASLLMVNGGDGSAGFILNGPDAGDRSGHSVSSAGDINGDGFDDILIGAPRADPNGGSSGETYVIFGSGSGFGASLELSSLDGTNGFVLNGIDANDFSGRSVSSAGDINGDGFDDILIGAVVADPNGSASGESYVVFGSGSGFGASLDLSSLNGTNGFVINGIDVDDRSGISVSGTGDINGDGFDDILIGAYQADPNGSQSGESYVVFGKGTGFGASLDLSSLNGTNGFVLNGIDVDDNSGFSVSDAGDINGDGFDDILIGAKHAEPNGVNSGESYVIFGSNMPFTTGLDLSSLNGSNGFVINGIDAGDMSGVSVSSAGDINGDGFDDILIGANWADPHGASSGETYVIFGSNAGFGASLDLSSLNGSNGFVINGVDAVDYSGSSVSGAGDINGDGFDDILIGASRADPNGGNSGESYVVFGKASGFGAGFELAGLNGANGFVINGIDAIDRSGGSVSGAGDINGDGFDDILIGARLADPNGSDSGESYIIYGRANFGITTEILTQNADNYTARLDGQIIYALGGDDFIKGAAGSDTIYGEAGDDLLIGFDGRDYLFGGDGGDILRGQGGDDQLMGGEGGDALQGGLGDDELSGEAGDDVINGQGGDDIINGGDGQDNLLGASGNDVISGGTGNDDINGNGGDDTIDGGGGGDDLRGAVGFDTINGGNGDDIISGGNQNDTLNGNGGNDILNGDNGNDIVNGGAHHDTLTGAGGQDMLYGGFGHDTLSGNSGGDDLFGGDGNDILDGGGGNDDINGGAGADVFVASLGFRTDRIQDFEDGIDLIDFSNNSLANNIADVLAAATQVGANVRIDLNPNNALILENFDLSDLDAGDFIF